MFEDQDVRGGVIVKRVLSDSTGQEVYNTPGELVGTEL